MVSYGRDSGLAWLAVIGAFINALVYSGMTQSFGTLYLVMLDRFHAGEVKTSWVGTLNLLMVGLGGLLSAWMCKVFSHRLIGFIGAVIVITGFTLTAYATSIVQVFIWYGIVSGVGMSLAFTASLLVVDRNFERLKATAMGLAFCGSWVGAFIFPPLLETVEDEYGYRTCVLCLAFSSLLLMFNVILFRLPGEPVIADAQMIFHGVEKRSAGLIPNIGEPNRDYQSCTLSDTETGEGSNLTDSTGIVYISTVDVARRPLPTDSANGSNVPEMEKSFWDWRLLCNLGVLALLLQNINVQAFESFGSQYTPAFAIDQGIPRIKSSLLLSATGVAGLLIPLCISILLDLPLMREYLMYVVNLCVVISGVLELCTPFCYTYALLMFMVVMKSGLIGVFMTQRVTMSGMVAEKQTAAVFGLSLVLETVGTVIGRMSGGAFKEKFGSYDPGFYLTGIMCIVGSILFHLATVVETKRKRYQDLTPLYTETER